MRVVAFWTNESYFREIVRLHDSMERFGLHYQTEHVPGKKGWLEAVMAKPRFILHMLETLQDSDVFYTDADSSFKKAPDWRILAGLDVAWAHFKGSPVMPAEHLTGSMFFRNTSAVRDFVEDWAEETERGIYAKCFTPEQDSLAVAWARIHGKGEIRFGELPPEYCWFDTCREVYGPLEPVIEHRQASRRYRHATDEEAAPEAPRAPAPAQGEGAPAGPELPHRLAEGDGAQDRHVTAPEGEGR